MRVTGGPGVGSVVGVVGVVALVAASIVGGVLASSAPATAAAAAGAPRLLVSDDGEHWQGRLDQALFGDDLRLVPGASTTGTFWVKNTSGSPAALDARLVDVSTSSPAFAEAVTVSSHSDLDLGGLPPVTLAGDGCTAVLAPLHLDAGQEAPVTVSVSLDESAGEGTGDQTLDFGVLVTLTGLAGADLPVGCSADGATGPGGSADTGAGGAARDRVASTTVEAVATRASSGARAGGAASSVDGSGPASVGPAGSGPAGVGPAGVGGTGRPVQSLGVLDDFVPVPLRGSWLPYAIAAIAVLSGAFVAVGRRRPGGVADASDGDRDETTGRQP